MQLKDHSTVSDTVAAAPETAAQAQAQAQPRMNRDCASDALSVC